MAKPPVSEKLRYGRVLVKLSGEALAGKHSYGFDPETITSICSQKKMENMNGLLLLID